MQNKVIRIEDLRREAPDLGPAVRALERGEIIAFPTETVYGLGIRPDIPGAMERLNRIKGRREDHPLTLHLAEEEDIQRHTGTLTPLSHRLLSRFSPGPLTLVLPGPGESKEVGIRVPRHPVCQALLQEVRGALLATSANFTGSPSPVEADAIAPDLADKVAWIVDAGPSHYRAASTVVRPRCDVPEVIREGAIPSSLILDEIGPVPLIICMGNTCRSPMASRLLEARIAKRFTADRQERGLPLPVVRSAGIGAVDGSPASRGAVLAMKARGMDLHDPISTRLLPSHLKAADFILAVTPSIGRSIRNLLPEVEHRIDVMNESAGGIPDPIGGSVLEYEACAALMEAFLEAFLDRNVFRFQGQGKGYPGQ